MKITNPKADYEMKDYFQISGEIGEEAICWTLIEAAFSSPANTAIIPMQDLLCLGSEARMNIPNTIGGRNWGLRLRKGMLTTELEEKLASLSELYGRNKN